MQDKSKRLPVPAAHLPDFAPVPRKVPRHDGWTPARQRAFVEALADTGCVRIAARMVNMTPESAYMLRRAPGAEAFRKAWEAAQGLGLQVVKDEAFDRALNGQLVPVFVGGNAAALAKADPSAVALAKAEATTTTVKTIISGKGADPRPADDEAAHLLESFAGVDLDDQAKADIYRALEVAAERRRALDDNPAEDPDIAYVGEPEAGPYAGELELGVEEDWVAWQPDGEHGWRTLGEGGNAAEIDRAVAAIRAERASAAPAPDGTGERLLEAPATTLADLKVGETRRSDKERQRKPASTPPDEARKVKAVADVAVEQQSAAKAEGQRRPRRKTRSRDPGRYRASTACD